MCFSNVFAGVIMQIAYLKLERIIILQYDAWIETKNCQSILKKFLLREHSLYFINQINLSNIKCIFFVHTLYLRTLRKILFFTVCFSNVFACVIIANRIFQTGAHLFYNTISGFRPKNFQSI